LTLAEPKDVALFFLLGGPAACLVNASLSTLALRLLGIVGPAGTADNWWIWWTGDTFGVLIGAPVVLTLIGRPREEWRANRRKVAIALLALTTLLCLACGEVARRDHQRAIGIFSRDAERATASFSAQFERPLYALEAIRSTIAALHGANGVSLQGSADFWLRGARRMRAIGWAESVARQQVPAFEAQVRERQHEPGYRVFDAPADMQTSDTAGDPDVVAIREMHGGNPGAVGLNLLSFTPVRAATLSALRTLQPAASAGFHLLPNEGGDAIVVVYQAVREQAHSGVVFVTLQLPTTFAEVSAQTPSYLHWCLWDETPGNTGLHQLAGGRECERASARSFRHRSSMSFAGRDWRIEAVADEGFVPDTRRWNARLLAVSGLVAIAIVGAMLLTITGRARRIEAAVTDRTADLHSEIAERRRAEAAWRESEQRLRAILDHVPIGVIYASLDGRIVDGNPRLCALSGYPIEELVGMSALWLTHPDDRDGDRELMQRLLAGDLPLYRNRRRYLRKDGTTIPVETVVTALRDDTGRPQMIVGVVEDISDQLRRQDAERERDQAEAANQAKTDFVSRMSHELRTPLNAVLGFAQLLHHHADPASPAQLQWIEQIQQAGWHLLRMIDDTLDLSRIESGSLRLELADLSLDAVIGQTLAFVQQEAAKRNIALERPARSGLSVRGDATRVKQILTNLLSNAVKYNAEGGRVSVTVRQEGAEAEIEVRDTGPGMTPAQQAQLFQPFNRLGRDKESDGTGIGLVISKYLAELMSGRLEVESAPGRGSSFRLRLPMADARAAVAAGTAEPQAPPAAAGARQRLVHYIEDNEVNAEVMRGIVATLDGVRLEVWPTGAQGLDAIRREPPGAILLDMHLPDIDGIGILRHVKQDPKTAAIPVIVVSADATLQRVKQALALGAQDYITKPMHAQTVLDSLRQVLAIGAARP
jgi:PAS domain S-box-containing protein